MKTKSRLSQTVVSYSGGGGGGGFCCKYDMSHKAVFICDNNVNKHCRHTVN